MGGYRAAPSPSPAKPARSSPGWPVCEVRSARDGGLVQGLRDGRPELQVQPWNGRQPFLETGRWGLQAIPLQDQPGQPGRLLPEGGGQACQLVALQRQVGQGGRMGQKVRGESPEPLGLQREPGGLGGLQATGYGHVAGRHPPYDERLFRASGPGLALIRQAGITPVVCDWARRLAEHAPMGVQRCHSTLVILTARAARMHNLEVEVLPEMHDHWGLTEPALRVQGFCAVVTWTAAQLHAACRQIRELGLSAVGTPTAHLRSGQEPFWLLQTITTSATTIYYGRG